MLKKFILVVVVLGCASFARAVVTPANTDFQDYCTGRNNSNCVFKIDSSGNVTGQNVTSQGTLTATGNATHTAGTLFTQQQVTGISTTTTITPTGTFLVVNSTGGMIVMAGSGSNNVPIIATATATNGQIVVLISTASTAQTVGGQVTVSSGSAAGLQLGAATRALFNGRTLGLIFDSASSTWKELFYGAN